MLQPKGVLCAGNRGSNEGVSHAHNTPISTQAKGDPGLQRHLHSAHNTLPSISGHLCPETHLHALGNEQVVEPALGLLVELLHEPEALRGAPARDRLSDDDLEVPLPLRARHGSGSPTELDQAAVFPDSKPSVNKCPAAPTCSKK